MGIIQFCRAVLLGIALVTAFLNGAVLSRAVMITSGPAFIPAGSNAPLAGVLQIFTDTPSRVSVSVNDGLRTWDRDFLDYTNVHATTLVGFKANRTNEITVTVWDQLRDHVTVTQPVVFVTAPLPAGFPKMSVLQCDTNKMEPGYTLFRALNFGDQPYVVIIDNLGDVVWYSAPQTLQDVRQLPNGDLLVPTSTRFTEYNMLGQTVQIWPVPSTRLVNGHEDLYTDHGTILYFSNTNRIVTNFPSSSINSNAPTRTTNVMYQLVQEISTTNAALLNTWSTIDMLDPRRISYLTFATPSSTVDWGHANAIIEDPSDDSLIVSIRHQNAVIKFARATGQLKWILGPPANWGPPFQPYLLTPVGEPFEWNYGQHAPELTPQGTLLLHDNGNYRASPFDAWVADATNYTRAVEYSINEDSMEVSQVWEYASTNETLYSGALGDAHYLKNTGNVLVHYGNISYVDGVHPNTNAPGATMVRIKEVTHEANPEVVFDLAVFDYANSNYQGSFSYRSYRIPDLYSVLPQPVVDLRVMVTNDKPHLVFSGDANRTYVVEASTNLLSWKTIGQASLSAGANFDFDDPQEADYRQRFYRVVTQ
jgi:hypothetical protein